MKLGFKIILPILLFLVIVTGAFGYILYNLKQQGAVLSTEGAKIRSLNGLNERLVRQQDQTGYYILAYRFNQDKASLLAISQAELDKSKTLDEMFPFITTSYGRELINIYIDSRKTIESLRNELIQAIDDGDKEQINLSYNKWDIQTQNINAALADIGAYNINSLEKTLVMVGDIRNKISEIITILVFVVIATVLFLFLYLRAVITTPIIKLAEFADEVAKQNFTTTTTTTTTRKDELGILSRAFNTMVVKLKESYETLERKVVDRTAELTKKTQEAENSQKATLNVLEDLKIDDAKLAESNKKLENLDRLKDEFVSIASHELRTPLTAIDGLVSMILDGEYGEVNSNLKQPLEDVNTSSARLIHLVNDLLNLSRIQAGRLKYNLSDFSIPDAISEVVKLLLPMAQQKKLKLQIGHIDKVNVQADRDKVEEIFDNLIGNSLKFTDKGSIIISAKSVESKVNVYVTDTGIGIAKEDQARLFGIFEQLQSDKERTVGTGLGLHISRELVRKMGGELWIEKSEKSVGSTFAFSLPLAKSKLATKAREEIKKETKANPDQKAS